MTAERWWVRLAARWLARVDGVSGQLRLAMLGMTGFSTATMTLKQYGYGDMAWPFIIATGLAGVAYTYLYTEGGVWNQMSRDRTDMSDNYSGPTMLFDSRLEARQMALLAHMLSEDDMSLEEREERMVAVAEDEWKKLRDGIDIEDIEERQ